ncbi:MAG TPA: SxtJ family membrane protein [Chthoniobacterales bacterium]|nr:SxtJ family membrane protein [Chthoniobacterales bacterium]
MINPFADVNWNPDLAERRKFATSLIVGFPIVAAILTAIWLVRGHSWNRFALWLGGIGLAIGILLWLIPQIARPLYVVWYALACSIGIVVANLLFSAFYYLLLTPIGLCLRATRSLSFRKGFSRDQDTYWKDVTPVTDLRRYYRQF